MNTVDIQPTERREFNTVLMQRVDFPAKVTIKDDPRILQVVVENPGNKVYVVVRREEGVFKGALEMLDLNVAVERGLAEKRSMVKSLTIEF